MALAHINLSNTSLVTIYTCPANTRTVAVLSICNRNATAADISVALSASNTASNTDYLEYLTSCSSYGIIERSGLLLSAGDVLFAQTSVANVSVVVYGIQETI